MKKIYIEITNHCNLACPFCAPSARFREWMPAAAFAEVLARLHGHTRHLALHVLGEPLLHPRLAQLLILSHTHGMRVNLTTNGTLLDRQQHTLLTAPALRQISVSLHGLEPLPRQAAANHLRRIIAFALEASRTTALHVSLRLWNLPAREHGAAGEWNDWLLQRLTAAFAGPSLSAAKLRSTRGIALAPRVFLNPESRFAWPRPEGPDLGGRGRCRGLRDHVAILVDGTVVPCCLDAEGRIPLGNIFHQSLAEILAGPRAQRMRAGFGHQWLVEPLCRRCSYRTRFAPPDPERQGERSAP